MAKIKVLCISHVYIVPFNLRKIQALARHKDLEIEVVTADRWDDYPLRNVTFEKMSGLVFNVYPLRVFFSGRHLRHFYEPLPLWMIAHHFKPDVIHVEEEPGSLALCQAILLKKLLGCKVLVFTWENTLWRRSVLVRELERFTLAQADAVIAGNEEAKLIVRRKGFRGDIAVLPQFGVDPEFFSPRRDNELRAKLGLRRPTIGFVGRLEERKGVFTLVEAAANLGIGCDLLFVGSGPAKENIIERSRQIDSDINLVFVDTVPSGEVANYMNCMDILVLPSLTTSKWKEQFGRVLVEAMACGIPVIGSDSGAIPEVIGDAGLIFHEGEVGELRTLLRMLMTDPELRADLGQRGRNRVKTRYTEEIVADRTYEIYRSLAG